MPSSRECVRGLHLASYAFNSGNVSLEGDRPDSVWLQCSVHTSLNSRRSDSVGQCLPPQTRKNVGVFLLTWFTPFLLFPLPSSLLGFSFPSFHLSPVFPPLLPLSPALPAPPLLNSTFLTTLIHSDAVGCGLCYRDMESLDGDLLYHNLRVQRSQASGSVFSKMHSWVAMSLEESFALGETRSGGSSAWVRTLQHCQA